MSRTPESVHTFSMGERVELGHIIYTVFDTQWMTQLGEGTTARIPQHRYFLIRISAVNSGGADVMVPNTSIVDDNGNTYAELSNGDNVPLWIGFLRQVRPAQAAQGNLLFDAPPRRYKLQLKDESGERTGVVDIPLAFGGEMPDAPVSPLPEQKKR